VFSPNVDWSKFPSSCSSVVFLNFFRWLVLFCFVHLLATLLCTSIFAQCFLFANLGRAGEKGGESGERWNRTLELFVWHCLFMIKDNIFLYYLFILCRHINSVQQRYINKQITHTKQQNILLHCLPIADLVNKYHRRRYCIFNNALTPSRLYSSFLKIYK